MAVRISNSRQLGRTGGIGNIGKGSVCLLLAGWGLFVCAAQEPIRFNPLERLGNGWMKVTAGEWPRFSPGQSDLFTLSASSDLVNWLPVAVLHDEKAFQFVDPATPEASHRFYRFSVQGNSPANDWKNQVYSRFGVEPFAAWVAESGYVKFAILANDPTRVSSGRRESTRCTTIS